MGVERVNVGTLQPICGCSEEVDNEIVSLESGEGNMVRA